MNLIEFWDEKSKRVIDARLAKEDRLLAFSSLVDYVSGMKSQSPYLIAIISAILDAFDGNWGEDVIQRLFLEFSGEIGYRSGVEKCVVLSEENYIAKTLRELYSDKIQFIAFSEINEECIEYYDYFVICGVNDLFGDNGGYQGKKINLYQICRTGYEGYPMTWKVWSSYLDKVNNCNTLITGMSYIRDALNVNLLGDNVCNVANSSQDIYYDFLCFKDAIKRNANISELIIGLAPYSLRYDLSLVQNPTELKRLFFYYGIFEDAHNNICLKDELIEYGTNMTNLKKLFGTDFANELYVAIRTKYEMDDDTKEKCVFSEQDMVIEELRQMQGKYNKPYEETYKENCRLLEEYIRYAIESKCKVTVFIPLYSEWYRNRWNPDYLVELRKVLSELKEKYVFELVDLSGVELPYYYFGDYAHLNRLGSIYTISAMNNFG